MKYMIGNALYFAIMFYILLLSVRVLLSWINLPPNSFTMWICKLTDPVLNFFRRNFPVRFGVFDLSIIVPVTILLVAGRMVSDFMVTDSYELKMLINAWYLLGLLIFIVDIVAGFILSLYIIITLIVLIFLLIGQGVGYNQAVSYFYGVISPLLRRIGYFIKMRSSKHSEIISLFILLVFLILLNILKTNVVAYLSLAVNTQIYDVNAIKNFKETI